MIDTVSSTVIYPTAVVSPTTGVHTDWSVVIEEGRISYAGPRADEPEPPENAKIVEADECSLMPGWIDAHTHMFGGVTASGFDDRRQMFNGVRSCWRAVKAGLTSVVDLGCRSHDIFALRSAAEQGLFVAPRIFSAGQAICMTGGHGFGKVAVEADGVDGVRQMTRRQLGAGADVIKLMATGGAGSQYEAQGGAQFDVDELAAGVVEAEKARRPATAHATSADGILVALEAGVNVIQHGTGMSDTGASQLASRDGYVVPTMSVGPRSARGTLATTPPYMAAKSAAKEKAHVGGIQAALANGVTVGFGTDSGGEYHPLGDTALEVALLTDLGMKPMDIIMAATHHNAAWLGVGERIGDIRGGMEADLVLVAGDAANDAASLTAVSDVWARGRHVVANSMPIAGAHD